MDLYLLTDSINLLLDRIVYLRRRVLGPRTLGIRNLFAVARCWHKCCWDRNLQLQEILHRRAGECSFYENTFVLNFKNQNLIWIYRGSSGLRFRKPRISREWEYCIYITVAIFAIHFDRWWFYNCYDHKTFFRPRSDTSLFTHVCHCLSPIILICSLRLSCSTIFSILRSLRETEVQTLDKTYILRKKRVATKFF